MPDKARFNKPRKSKREKREEKELKEQKKAVLRQQEEEGYIPYAKRRGMKARR